MIERLNEGLHRKLTIISAPAGFGKSTLLSSWVHQKDVSHPYRVAWLSLDDGDNDLIRFLTYFIAALQTIDNEIGREILDALQSPGGVNVDIVLTTILNEIAEFSENVVLIFDDYHVIESSQIDQVITFLLEHLPPQMHLVIASRIDPTLPLPGLRARGQMIEIRANELRFMHDEVVDFLNQIKGFDLSRHEIVALGERTEGWIAGLHLAAISIQGLKDSQAIADFINQFTGSDRYIHDYLADEVLQQQPEEIQEFLLQTSILDRLCGPLCDTVCSLRAGAHEKSKSQQILEALESANLFIIPLDNERYWYRYHHLFADLLLQRLQQTHQEQIPRLHNRASQWYGQNDLPSDAIRHALTA